MLNSHFLFHYGRVGLGARARSLLHSLLQVGAVQVDATGGRGHSGDIGKLLSYLILVLLGKPPIERAVPVSATTGGPMPLQRLVATGGPAAAVRHIHVCGRADHHLGGRL